MLTKTTNPSHVMSREEEVMASHPIGRLFLMFSIPGVCSILFMSMQTIIDGMFLGNFVSANALAAVNMTMPSFALFLALETTISVGSEFRISSSLGRGDRQGAANAFTSACIMGFVLSVLWALATLLFAPEIVHLLGANDALREDCIIYLRTIGLFCPFATLLFLGDYTLRALGHPVQAVRIMATVVATNIVLDFLFIVVFGWGVAGAAWATGISFILGFALNFVPFLIGRRELCVFEGTFNARLSAGMFYNGSSEGMAEGMAGMASLLFNLTLINYAGEVGVAAYSAFNYLNFVSIAFYLGISDGIRPVLSYNFGRKAYARMRSMLAVAFGTILGIGLILFTITTLFSHTLLALFFDTQDAAVVDFAVNGARIFAYTFLFSGLNILASGYFTSIGRAGISAVIAALHGLVFVAMGLMILPKIWGIDGIWMVLPMAEFLALAISLPLLWLAVRRAW